MNTRMLLLLLIFIPNSSFAAIEYFLHIEGVPGESATVGHEDEIVVLG